MKGISAFIVLLIVCVFLVIFLVFARQKADREVTETAIQHYCSFQ
jgi:heme/copper-type cytochrome/quinol oxidase subunit 2